MGMAQAQGQANLDATKYNNRVNRVNQVTPYGSQTWSNTSQFDQQGYDQAMQQWNAAGGKKSGAPMPNREAFAWEDWTQTQNLAPAQQALLDSSNRISQNLANTAETGLSRVGQAMATPFNTSGLPALQSLNGGMVSARPRVPTQGVGYQGMPVGQVNGGQGYEQSRQAVVNSLMSRAQPQLDQARQGRETALLNSGIERGSEAWNREQANLGQTENDARMQAILAGGQEQSRLAGLDLQAGQFANSTASQDLANRISQGTFGNQAQGQQFSQQMAIDNLINSLQQRNASFNNQARQQGIQEQAYLRSLPLNELNALRSGAQVTSPQFGSYYTNNTQAAPLMDAAIAQGNYNMQAAQQQQSGANALMGGLANLGSAGMMAYFSDARLKSNIRPIGKHPSGVDRVRWTWADGSEGLGVIAQDLQAIRPEAVSIDPSGFLRVDYSLIGGF